MHSRSDRRHTNISTCLNHNDCYSVQRWTPSNSLPLGGVSLHLYHVIVSLVNTLDTEYMHSRNLKDTTLLASYAITKTKVTHSRSSSQLRSMWERSNVLIHIQCHHNEVKVNIRLTKIPICGYNIMNFTGKRKCSRTHQNYCIHSVKRTLHLANIREVKICQNMHYYNRMAIF